MFTSFVVFFAVSWAQIASPVTSVQFNSKNLVDGFGENRDDTGELELFQRGLNDGVPVRELNINQIVSVFGRVSSNAKNHLYPYFQQLIEAFQDSLLTQLIQHIMYLLDHQHVVQQYPRQRIPPSNIFDQHFTKEKLLECVKNLPDENAAVAKQTLNTLTRMCKNTELEVLFSNISELLDFREPLQRYGRLCENVDKAFGLDQPIDILKLRIPVPTTRNPNVYFELKDENNPNIRVLVKIKLERDAVVASILTRLDSDMQSQAAFNELRVPKNQIKYLYKKLPITHITKH